MAVILKYLSSSWYFLSLLAIFLFSLSLRFWNLGQFNEFVFDEAYYAKFANNYLTNTHFFNAHPPLSQYIIALGIWLGSFFPAPPEMVNNLTGSVRSTLSYRWINALSGSFIPLLVASLGLKLTLRRSYALLAALLVSLDGLFLVESRYALNNIYLVIFGLLGHLFFLIYLSKGSYPIRHLILSGIFFGAAACIKWNGLWFLLGIYLMIILGFLVSLWQYPLSSRKLKTWLKPSHLGLLQKNSSSLLPLGNLTVINPLYHLFILTIAAAITYSLLWIPHLILNPEYNFWQMQYEILSYHERIKSGPDVHPYCSTWYSWILMLRPIAYYYKLSKVDGSPEVIYDVHAMANPLLLWLSTLAIFSIFLWLIVSFLKTRDKQDFLTPLNWILVYFILNYLANLLPWIKVTRCLFFYHYIESYTFAILALAWIIEGWLRSRQFFYKGMGISTLLIILVAFIYWLPIYLGIPLSVPDFNLKMLLPSWV